MPLSSIAAASPCLSGITVWTWEKKGEGTERHISHTLSGPNLGPWEGNRRQTAGGQSHPLDNAGKALNNAEITSTSHRRQHSRNPLLRGINLISDSKNARLSLLSHHPNATGPSARSLAADAARARNPLSLSLSLTPLRENPGKTTDDTSSSLERSGGKEKDMAAAAEEDQSPRAEDKKRKEEIYFVSQFFSLSFLFPRAR